jgi:hypothetical protein
MYLLLFETIVFVPVLLKIEQVNKSKLPPKYCSLMAVLVSLSITYRPCLSPAAMFFI